MLKIDDSLPYTEEEIKYLQRNKEYHAKKKLRRDLIITPVKTKHGKDSASTPASSNSPQNPNPEAQKPAAVPQHHPPISNTSVRDQAVPNKRQVNNCDSPSNTVNDAKEAAKQLLRSGAIKLELEPKEKTFKPSSNLEKRLSSSTSQSSNNVYSLSPNSMDNVKLQTNDVYSNNSVPSVKGTLDDVVNQQMSYHQVPVNSQYHKHFSNSLAPLNSLQQINSMQYFSQRMPMTSNIPLNACQQNSVNRFNTPKTSHSVVQQQYSAQQNYQMHQFPKMASQNQHFSCLSPQMTAISTQQLPNMSPTPLPSMPPQRFNVSVPSQTSVSQSSIGTLPSFDACEDIALYIRPTRGQLSYDSLKLLLQPYGLTRLEISTRGDSACAALGCANECRRAVRELNNVNAVDLTVSLIRRNNAVNSGEQFPGSSQWNAYEFDPTLSRMMNEDRHIINYAASDFFT